MLNIYIIYIMAKTRNKLSTKKKVRKTQSKQQKTSKKKKN